MRSIYASKWSIGAWLLAVLAVAVASSPMAAFAALPAPTWLPNQPILAGNQVIAMWLPVPGAVKYNIYVNGTKSAESPVNQFIGPAPEGSGKFEYKLTAVDASGAESPQSGAGFITITKLNPPDKPIARDYPDEKAIVLRWNRPAGASIFNVYRAPSKDGPWELKGSVQEESFKDGGLEPGTYWYSVTSKDMMGKESDRGAAVDIVLKKQVVAAVAKKFELTIVPTRLTRTVRLLGDLPIGTLTRLKMGPDGQLYMLDRTEIIRVTDPKFQTLKYISVPIPEGASLRDFKLWNIDWIDDNTVILCDLGNKVVLIFDLSRQIVTQVIRPVKPTPEQNKAVYDQIQPAFKGAKCQPLAAVPLKDGRYLVSDGDGPVLTIVNEKGQSVDWRVFYSEESTEGGETAQRRFAIVPDLKVLDDGTVLAFSDKILVRVDPETWKSKWIIGEFGTMVGNFIGFGGMNLLPGGGRIAVADQTMHTVQVFNLETGNYLFSFGGPEKKPDPAQTTRAAIDFNAPMYPFILPDGSLSLYLGFQMDILVRQLLEPMP